MIFRLLALSILSLEVLASPAKAIPKAPSQDALLSVQQNAGSEDSLTRVLMGVAAIGLFATPFTGYALYKQHLAYKEAIRRNCIERLERAWTRSKSR